MSLGDSDVSWSTLRRIVKQWRSGKPDGSTVLSSPPPDGVSDAAADIAEVRHLSGGCINNVLGIVLQDGSKVVLKLSPHRVDLSLKREAFQLEQLRDAGVPVPRVYAWHLAHLDDPNSWILLEHVDGVDLATARKHCTPDQFDSLQRHLAEIVLTMHNHTGPCYERLEGQCDGHQGFSSWAAFFHHVYDPIWQDAKDDTHLKPAVRSRLGKIHDKLESLLAHDDVPRLTHWDIWATNILAGPDESGNWRVRALLDPNCKYAHAEAELAYMELFQTITPAFIDKYKSAQPLAGEYHVKRKPVYQLYSLLNHLRLFGAQYVKPVEELSARVAAVA